MLKPPNASALVLERADRHDSGSCIRKSVGVRFSLWASKFLEGSVMRNLLILALFITCSVFTLSGCKRKTHDFAGVSNPSGPKYDVQVDPQRVAGK